MKMKIFLKVLVVMLCVFSNTYAQISQGGQPYSFTHSVPTYIEIKEMPKVDIEALLFEDELAPKDEPYRFGYGFDVSYNLSNSGAWEILSDSSKLWHLQITSPGAFSINLIYDKFYLPDEQPFSFIIKMKA